MHNQRPSVFTQGQVRSLCRFLCRKLYTCMDTHRRLLLSNPAPIMQTGAPECALGRTNQRTQNAKHGMSSVRGEPSMGSSGSLRVATAGSSYVCGLFSFLLPPHVPGPPSSPWRDSCWLWVTFTPTSWKGCHVLQETERIKCPGWNVTQKKRFVNK